VISIDTLPDDALLEIFDHYMYGVRLGEETQKDGERAWQSLVHVCRQWRSIVFGSSRRLDLRLVCTEGTRTKDRLDVWPALPLVVHCNIGVNPIRRDNIIAVLERTDRVCHILIRVIPNVSSSDLEIFLAAMQQPFPELTYLCLWSDEPVVIPDSFLGGSAASAPRLKHLSLSGISFPGLPKLLLSATHLVGLTLMDIPHSRYFPPPDTIVTVLSTLTSLNFLKLEFRSSRPRPDLASRRPPPLSRIVLPVLTTFVFKGASKYLEDLITHIDAPRLKHMNITVFHDIIFDMPQLIQFINRLSMSEALKKAHITLRERAASAGFSSQTFLEQGFMVGISCKSLDWQISFLERVCTSCQCLPFISMLEDLYFYEDPLSPTFAT
jgi:hypothetical protein